MGKLQKTKHILPKKSLKLKKKVNHGDKIKKKAEKIVRSKKKEYSKMSVDDILNASFDESSTESEGSNNEEEIVINRGVDIKHPTIPDDEDSASDSDAELEDDQVNDEENSSADEVLDHKESLAKLKETDPEFYKFLEENDKKLLDFNLSDSEDEQVEADEDNDQEKLHKPLGELEVASDESDFEDETQPTDSSVITLKMLKSWQNDVRIDKSNVTIVKLIKAFHAAITRVTNESDDGSTPYKVEGSAIFNGVIQLCVLELGPAVRRYLKIPQGSKQPPHKSKKFVKIKAILRGYFTDLLKLLTGVTSTNILNVLLKHLHYMLPMIVSYSSVVKQVFKKLINLWGTADETVRVIAFLCIIRLINNEQQNNLDMVLKSMYMTYVQNSKFVSPSTLPMINFMRRSLVEMYSIDLNVSYQHVFLYIRQLAIHLRNAITVKKKENIQAVYNWQYVNSLKLWGNLLGINSNKSQLQPLIYPFVQVCLGTINLIPTVQYYPLRFHLTELLIEFSSSTQIFIPILPFLLEILTSYDFNKKHQKVSMKPLQFLCILRLSKSQLLENGFKDSVIDTIYGQLLEYLALKSHSVAFPDLSFLCIIQIKTFLKKCSVAAYCRKMRQILEKIEQNNKFILTERKSATFNLAETQKIEAWETTIKNKSTPLLTYYESWKTMKNVKRNKEATNNEAIGEYNLPVLKKRVKSGKIEQKSDEKVELFPSDSDSDVDQEISTVEKSRRGKRGGKSGKKKPITVTLDEDNASEGEVPDIVEDLKVSDW
ncbi:nucleolar complex 2 and rad4-related [Holotrichia oblita]|uniref:Nucleolar complex 2 and rad4-related n=1 Tax=Holotrichia oblita TaxID=644536 RepID=A0ACB9SPT9_HOLOL|nr:nucleolar complex 2 and rad4-related [Holotrichia oblita]